MTDNRIWVHRGQPGGRRRRTAPGFCLVHVVVGQVLLNPELQQRYRVGDRLAQRIYLTISDEICRIATLGQDADTEIELPRDCFVEPAEGSARAGGIRIEREDDSLCEAPQQIQMLVHEGGAACGNGHGSLREMKGDHVGVPLDHHGFMLSNDGALGPVEPVQQTRFVIDRRLGGVQVFRPLALQQPCAETDRVAAEIEDGKHHASPKSIDESASP